MKAVDRIEQIIEEKGLNKARFCELMGVGTSYFSNWKRRGFPAKRLPKAAEILGVSVEELTSDDISSSQSAVREQGARYEPHYSPDVDMLAFSLDALLREGRITEKDIKLIWQVARRMAGTSENGSGS
ncbi:helix-turn-helix domain-containing protein [Guyparkeria halopsychrophila]|uniref:helix-turn-helix domain-containing protein n=1 Tax=Guyparkeria halopsychrophila TaxID=3139421 RepID=UPI0037CB8021